MAEPIDYSKIPDLAAALAKAQGEFQPITKTKTATVASQKGSYEYSYSTLDQIIAATRPALSKHGIACFQPSRTERDTVVVCTVLLHESGQSYTSPEIAMHAGGTPQASGSALTYAQRYSLRATLGVSAEDDDDDGRKARAAAKKSQRDGRDGRDPQGSQGPQRQASDAGASGAPPVPPAAIAPPAKVERARIVNTNFERDDRGPLYHILTTIGVVYTRDEAIYQALEVISGKPIDVDLGLRQSRRADSTVVRVIASADVVDSTPIPTDAPAEGGQA